MEKPKWEIENGITADRFEDRHKYYLQLARIIGIGWPEDQKEFMGHNIDYWKILFDNDSYLNNHSLSSFDQYYPHHKLSANKKKIPWSLSNTVCCLKVVIEEKILQDRKE